MDDNTTIKNLMIMFGVLGAIGFGVYFAASIVAGAAV